ncbi:MAG: F0F1 ATP synthase subunit B [Verrucomicrobiota bacterium]
MNLIPVFAAAAESAGETPFTQVARQFGWEPRLFLSQLVLFILVALVLTRFAYRPLMKMLEFRKEQIQESLKNAEKTRLELEKTEAARQQVMEQATAQANKFMEEARAAAAKVREQETQKAIAAAEDIIKKARQAAEADHARMLTELKREVGRLVVQTTATVTGKVLTPEDQKRLAAETDKQLAAEKPSH